jgi:subtilisin-like proprotein convertase family protein
MLIRLYIFLILIFTGSLLTAQLVVDFTNGAVLYDYDTRSFKETITVDNDFNKLIFNIDIDHSWVNDLEILITNPSGMSALVFNRLGDSTCFGCDGDNIKVSFFDNAQITYDSLNQTCGDNPAYGGNARAFQSLDQLLEGDSSGEWTIEVKDYWPEEEGYINNLSLVYTNYLAPECTGIVYPVNQQLDVQINDSLRWNPAEGATGYLLNFGTAPGVYDIENETDLGNVNYYAFQNLLCGTDYYFQILPYNEYGTAEACSESGFQTEFVTAEAIETVKLCAGETIELNAWGGDFYEWFPATGLDDPTKSDPVFSGKENQNYSVVVTNNSGCADTINVAVIVNTIGLTIDTINHVRLGKPGFIMITMDDPEGSYDFFWKGPNDYSSDQEDIEDLGVGCYELKVLNLDSGCELDTIICVDDLTSILSGLTSEEVYIYPNPVNDRLYLDFQDQSGEILQVELIDITGKVSYKVEKPASEQRLEIRTDIFPEGLYALRVSGDSLKKNLVIRIVKL